MLCPTFQAGDIHPWTRERGPAGEPGRRTSSRSKQLHGGRDPLSDETSSDETSHPPASVSIALNRTDSRVAAAVFLTAAG